MKFYDTPRDLNDYLDIHFECDCGKSHYAPLKKVVIRPGAIEELPRCIRELGYQRPYLIADEITYGIAGKKCMEILENAGVRADIHVLTHIGFDEATVGELLINMPADCDLCVAMGTGSINDMTRFFSSRMGRPFFTVATAAPMDGFASSIAAIYVNSLKTTFEAQTPAVIIGDTDILKDAPYRMIAAGLGDLLGKFTCLCDWKIARIITGEHYCPRIVELVETCARKVLESADRAKDRDPEVIGQIMEGLVLSGVAMSLYGNSRSASGCEHHMSHYWEMIFEQNHKRPVPHGTQVSVGMTMVMKLVEALLKRSVDFDRARACARQYDPETWKADIRRAYGPAADGVIEMEAQSRKNDTADRLARIDAMEQRWDEIRALLSALPKSGEMIALLRSLQSPSMPYEIDVDRELMRNTILYCKEVRPRYTMLQMMWDLGLLEELAEEVLNEVYAGQ